MKTHRKIGAIASAALLLAGSASAAGFEFSTGSPDGKIGTASRPASSGVKEIESADDFNLTQSTSIDHVSFTGLLTDATAKPTQVRVEIYRVFPADSDQGRTSGPPLFTTSAVPTRVNSPSDVAFAERDSAVSGDLTFSTSTLLDSFTALNSVKPGGIHAKPGQNTGGDTSITGTETRFDVELKKPIVLPADHYFLVAQVGLDKGDFFWLSAPKPIVAPGTPFLPDLQSWTRDGDSDKHDGLAPDWLRVGTDIVGGAPAPTFNETFSLSGTVVVPEPASVTALAIGLLGLAGWRRRTR